MDDVTLLQLPDDPATLKERLLELGARLSEREAKLLSHEKTITDRDALIASAERHELDVQLYLRSVLAWLPVIKVSELELYLPDRWKRDLMAEQKKELADKQATWRRSAGQGAGNPGVPGG